MSSLAHSPDGLIPTETLSALISQLETAEAGSRELDREIMALSYVWEQRHIGARCWDDDSDTCCPDAKHLDWVWVDPATDQWKTTAREGFDFTTSLDAALALAERVLPGCEPGVMVEQRLANGKTIWGAWTYVSEKEDAFAFGPALALCIAILRARVADSPETGGVGEG